MNNKNKMNPPSNQNPNPLQAKVLSDSFALMTPHALEQLSMASTYYFQERYAAEAPNTDDHGNFEVARDGIFHIAVDGILIHGDVWGLRRIAGSFTSYDYITDAIQYALASDDVKEVVLDVNSPGGMVSGCFKTAEEIRALSQVKKTTAIVNGQCCSAAYMLASNAGEIKSYTSSTIGSIGVVAVLYGYSKLYEAMGIESKVVCWPSGKGLGYVVGLDEKYVSRMQEHIDAISEDVVKCVELKLNKKTIETLDANVYTTSEALSLKLIDGIITAEQTLNIQKQENSNMNEEAKNNPPASSDTKASIPQGSPLMEDQTTETPSGGQDTTLADILSQILEESKKQTSILQAICDKDKKEDEDPADDGQQDNNAQGMMPGSKQPAQGINGLRTLADTTGESSTNPAGQQSSDPYAAARAKTEDYNKRINNK